MSAREDDDACTASLAKDQKKIPISEAVKAKRERAKTENHRRTLDEHGRHIRTDRQAGIQTPDMNETNI